MGLDIFFKEDICNALLAANEASAATATAAEASKYMNDELVGHIKSYREGYAAALATVALAFGISPAALCHKAVETEPPLRGSLESP